jgi:pentatricopeptide repeat protein
MLRAYIRSLRHPYDVVSFYEFFKFKLEADEEEDINYARSLVERHHSLIHDTVILAMLDHRLSTRQLLQVLGDMLRDNLPAKATESTNNTAVEEEASKPVHPAPTLFTLSILISRLLMRKEKMVAKQLMDVMREHGIEPNLETWNAMVKGYAALQDVPQTVSMLQKLEAAGYTPDNYTFKAFGRLRNQTQALSLMDKIIRQNEAKLAQEEVY